MECFKMLPAHTEGSIYGSYNPNTNELVTVGQDQMLKLWSVQEMYRSEQTELANQNPQQYTCISVSPVEPVVALGNQVGAVVLAQLHDPSKVQIVYRGRGRINKLEFCGSGRFLAIAPDEEQVVLYRRQMRKFTRCSRGHAGLLTNTCFTHDQSLLLTFATDAYINLYALTADHELEYLTRYKITSTQRSTNPIPICQKPSSNIICMGGNTNLQQLLINEHNSEYELNSNIHDSEEIQQLAWVGTNCLVTGANFHITIWNYHQERKVFSFSADPYQDVLPVLDTFFIFTRDGRVGAYENKGQIADINNLEEQPSPQQPNPEPQSLSPEPQPEKTKPQISKAAHLISIYPQTALQCHYEGYMQNRFLFYNQIGCIIERNDGRDSLIELQYHDKSKIRRTRFESSNKFIFYFALTRNCFVYGSLGHVYCMYEGYNRGKSGREHFLEKWEYRWNSIQGMAIGNCWVAVANEEEVKFFDFLGNQLHSICYDRKFMALAAYEDLFVLVYHGGIPMGGGQFFQMNIYSVDQRSCKLLRRSIVPIKTSNLITWLGFSQEGMLYVQDNAQLIRFYCWQADEWVCVLAGDEGYKIYIQHIEKYELYGFRIKQKAGEPGGPTVLPRSLPRKILLELPQPTLDQLCRDENLRLKHVALRKYKYEHEKWRHERWYKYKYSRNPNHPYYQLSANILTGEELALMLAQNDLQIVDYVTKILNKMNLPDHELNSFKYKLLHLCNSYIHSQQTKHKLQSLLACNTETYIHTTEYHLQRQLALLSMKEKKQSYCRIERIYRMVDLDWN